MEHIKGMELLMDHMFHKKRFEEFSKEELQLIPLDYIIRTVEPIELLYIWHKLPGEYRGEWNLQILLPCFVHYNRPDWRTHWDGPANSQASCHLCKLALEQIKNMRT
uniref:Uncharacterized protein LOC114348431 n=1 Tax=Diabrotica virgifera virgifera TaxID=50390 RepID=A0A6P7HAV2_DIAVI